MTNVRSVLAFAAAAEVATGLALLVDPSGVARWLLGTDLSAGSWPIGRCMGIALLGLGLACWPAGRGSEPGRGALRGMFLYSAGIAVYLGALGALGSASGALLWPAVGVHTVVALLLAWAGRKPVRA